MLSDVMVSSADKFFQNKNCHNIIFVVDVSKTIPICLLVQKGPYGVLINAIIIGLYVFVCSTQYGILYQCKGNKNWQFDETAQTDSLV